MPNTRQRSIQRVILLGITLAFLTSTPLAAQSLNTRRVLVGFALGKQFVKDSVWNEVDFTVFRETAKFEANYDITTDTAIDGGIAVRVWKRMGIGIVLSHYNKPTTAYIKAEVPHPFFFSFPRTTTGTTDDITRRELGVHLQVQYWRPISDNLLVRGVIGPSFFSIRHDLVSEIVTKERGFDYSMVDIVGYKTITARNGNALGYNVGLDISYFVRKHVALVLELRYSRGTSDVVFANRAQPALELGGTHLAGGLLFAF